MSLTDITPDRRHEERQVTYAPVVVAVSMLLFTVAITVWPPAVLGALAVAGLGVGIWVVDVFRNRQDMEPIGRIESGDEATWVEARSIHWWSAVAFAFVTFLFVVGAYRTLNAHALIGPDNWPPAAGDVTTPLSIAATLALVASALTATWAARSEAARERHDRIPLALGVTVGLGVLWLALVLAQLVVLARAGFAPSSGPAASSFFWVVGLHVVFVAAGALAALVAVAHARRGLLAWTRGGTVGAVALYWRTQVGLWLLTFALVYLRLVSFDTHLI